MEMRVDNYLRQEWNRHVDRALLVDVPTEYLIKAKREQIDQIVEKSIQEHGQVPKLFTEILQKAIGWLRGLIEYMRETEHCEIDRNGDMVLDHDLTLDLTPVSILLFHGENIITLREYCYSIRSWQTELPCGLIDSGETPDQAAVRKLKEETGYDK